MLLVPRKIRLYLAGLWNEGVTAHQAVWRVIQNTDMKHITVYQVWKVYAICEVEAAIARSQEYARSDEVM